MKDAPSSPGVESARLAELYRLGLADVPPRGSAGERMGRGTGASLEFQDRRAYAPGDDVRHVDWRALARTDQLMVRLWREEVLPRVEIVVDVSRSMSVPGDKARACVELTRLFAAIAREDGAQAVVIAADAAPRIVEADELASRGLELEGRAPLTEALRAASPMLRTGAVRVLISDFLFPHDAAELVRPFAARAGSIALVQLLSRDELEPRQGAHRLVDAESGAELDLVLDAPTIARYGERLERLAGALAIECRRTRGLFTRLESDVPLATLCRERLAREGLLVPR